MKATNDSRFHVGWRHFDAVRQSLVNEAKVFDEPIKSIVGHHVKAIGVLRRKVPVHSKLAAVAEEVRRTVEQGEKVVLFCHHHATAQELTILLDSVLPKYPVAHTSERGIWKEAWTALLDIYKYDLPDSLSPSPTFPTFVDWLCADMIRSQTGSWLQGRARSARKLAKELEAAKGRSRSGSESIANAAKRLYQEFKKSKSITAVLELAGLQPEGLHLPGGHGTSRVIGVCDPTGTHREAGLFAHNNQPDTVLKIFNSPFGPAVLVATDKLSEGIDLHRYCRHLIHYELDPSPIRTVQRNGRLRRVNSWAAVTTEPIRVAYPAFHGTRDYRLVQIMKKRVDNFSLLLGGVQEIDVEQIVGSDEAWRNEVIAKAKKSLAAAGGKLRAR